MALEYLSTGDNTIIYDTAANAYFIDLDGEDAWSISPENVNRLRLVHAIIADHIEYVLKKKEL